MEYLSAFGLPLAFALGALHALEPGHAKTLTAAYLIGIKGTRSDALVLGISVAISHCVVVILLSLSAYLAGENALGEQGVHFLQLGSAILVIGLGLWLMARSLSSRRKQRLHLKHRHEGHHTHDHHHHHHHAHHHGHEDSHHTHSDDHQHEIHDDTDGHGHHHRLPDYVERGERPSVLQIILFGAAGGIVPCPGALAVMLAGLSLNKAGMALLSVLGFSLGLACTLVAIGLLVVQGVALLKDSGKLSGVSHNAPLISAVLVLLSGVVALILSL